MFSPPVHLSTASRQRLAHANIVERLPPGVEDEDVSTEQWLIIDEDLVAEFFDEEVALGRRSEAELGIELAAEETRDDGRGFHEIGLEAIEIGPVRLEVTLEALAYPMRALHMLDELEGSRTHDLPCGIVSCCSLVWRRCRCS